MHAGFDSYVLGTYGGGRGKPKWIERIGKKYQWIALARLIGVAGDHIARTQASWDPPPPPVPGSQADRLRQLDPTVCEPLPEPDRAHPWVPSYDWARVANTPDAEWVAEESDLPDVAVNDVGDTDPRCVVLMGSYEWEAPQRPNGNHRRIWAVVATLLVKTDELDPLLAELDGQDLAGHDLFRAPMFTAGFVGEYPYGHHYGAELHAMNHEAWQPFSVPTMPATCDLIGEYEYAPRDINTISLVAPAPLMFGPAPGALQWDGRSAWVDPKRRVIASVRRMSGGGDQNELTMDYKWVDEWLRGANLAMMWIETVEKDVHAERFDSTPERLLRTRVRYRTADGITQLDPVCKRMPPHGW